MASQAACLDRSRCHCLSDSLTDSSSPQHSSHGMCGTFVPIPKSVPEKVRSEAVAVVPLVMLTVAVVVEASLT